MRTIKYLFIVSLMVLSFCSRAQELNQINEEKFYNIQFNGIKLRDIIFKQNTESTIQSLYTQNVSSEVKDIAGSVNIIYRINGCTFQFESHQDVGENSFDIKFAFVDETAVIKVNEIDISIGDSISKLGNVVINNIDKTVTFSQEETTSSLDINYTESDGKKIISEIRMIFY